MSVRRSLVLACAILQGCVFSSTERIQVIALRTQNEDGAPVVQARCALKNDKGAWEVTAPAQVPVIRSAGELSIQCRKQGLREGRLRVGAYPIPALYGIQIIGREVDPESREGVMYGYPQDLQVMMGASVFLEQRPR